MPHDHTFHHVDHIFRNVGGEVGDSLQVKDLRVENATITSDMDSTVVTIVAPSVIEEPKVAVAEEGEEEKPAEEGEEEKKEEEPEAKEEKPEK